MKPPMNFTFGKDNKETEKVLRGIISDVYDRIGAVQAAPVSTVAQPSLRVIQAVTAPGQIKAPIIAIPGPDFPKIIPPTVYVGGTLAGSVIPSSFYLDLRLYDDSTTIRHITANWLSLHDNSSPWQTLGLSTVDLTNVITTAGPIVNGRDQSAAFASTWIYFFVIYNSAMRTVGTLSSLSNTAPTLPTGYDYFMYVGASYVTSGEVMSGSAQFNDRCYRSTDVLIDAEPAVADIFEEHDISDAVPPTAKVVSGQMGASSTIAGRTGLIVAASITGLYYWATVIEVITIGVNDYYPASAVTYIIPLLTSQRLYWKGLDKVAKFYVSVREYIDDV